MCSVSIRSVEPFVCDLIDRCARAVSDQDLQRIAGHGLQRLLRAHLAVRPLPVFRGELGRIAGLAALVPRFHNPQAPLLNRCAGHRALLVTAHSPRLLPAYLLWREQPFTSDEASAAESFGVALVALHLHWAVIADRTAPGPVIGCAPGLTRTELAILQHLAAGLSADSIARLSGISPRTVRKHLQHVYAKLGAHDRLVAGERARAQGLIFDAGHAVATSL